MMLKIRQQLPLRFGWILEAHRRIRIRIVEGIRAPSARRLDPLEAIGSGARYGCVAVIARAAWAMSHLWP